jgi:hypothetical protein
MQPIVQLILQRKSEASDDGSKTPANGTPIPLCSLPHRPHKNVLQ